MSTFTVLLSHDRSILNKNLGHDSTPLSSACFGSDPTLALYLLKEGADPNAGSFYRLSTLGIALMDGQPMILIRALIEYGAETDSVMQKAVRITG